MKPVIGISTYVEPTSRGDWVDVPSALVPAAYVAHVESAGGVALLIPPRHDTDDELAGAILSRVDGLIIAGGADVDPSRYGATRHPSVQEPRADRDITELALARASAGLDLPTLGICRGMQVMAVAAGGALEQHVPDRVGDQKHSIAPAVYSSHQVAVVDGTRMAGILGHDVTVPCYHHQSVLTHPGYVPAAWDDDGTLEAMEDPGASFRIAVQWHPEVGSDPRLFDALVAAALVVAAGRAS